MNLLHVISLIYIFVNLHNISAFTLPLLPLESFGDGALQNFRKQAQLGESIRDWYIDIKDRIFGNVHSPDISTLMNHAKDDYEHHKKVFGGFWLDLTHLSFDPTRDWGFHLGPWFIIKKFGEYFDTSSVNLSYPVSNTPETMQSEQNHHEKGEEKSFAESTPSVITYNYLHTITHTVDEV